MKLIVLILTSFFAINYQNINTIFEFDTVLGEYAVCKTKIIKENASGWDYAKRYERKLILMKDSTYKEINTTFETFDMVDFYGTWTLSDNTITLQPKGILDYYNGKWTPNKASNFDGLDLSESKLKIDSEGRLEILR